MSITAIMTRLAAIEAGIAGIETAFDESPEAVNDADLPAVVNMLNTGLYEYDASGCRTTHNLNLHLLVAPRGTDAGLPALEAQTQPFVRRFRVTFEQALLLNELAGVELARLRGYRYGEISYGGRAYLGCTFNLQVVELGTTVAAATTPTVRRAGLDAIIERLCAIETDPDTGVAGLATAYDGAPERVEAADLPAVVHVADTGDLLEAAVGLGRTDHRLKLLFLLAERGSDAGLMALETVARPYVERFRDVLAANCNLGLASVSFSELQQYRYGGIVYNSPDQQPNYLGLLFDLLIVEKEHLDVAS